MLAQHKSLPDDYYKNENDLKNGLPTVQFLAGKPALSPGYLSDMLRNLTGLNARQHIHQKLIGKTKAYLAASSLSVAEIAYPLGFEHPQSFSKLFKKKTSQRPGEYKQSLKWFRKFKVYRIDPDSFRSGLNLKSWWKNSTIHFSGLNKGHLAADTFKNTQI